jgi:predicted RNase H-like HicB family nuclease
MTESYTVVIERDPESGWLVAEVVELPGCYTQAPDLPTLEANVREAIAVFLEEQPVPEDHPEFVGTWRVQMSA